MAIAKLFALNANAINHAISELKRVLININIGYNQCKFLDRWNFWKWNFHHQLYFRITSYFHTPLLLLLKINSNDYYKLNISFVTMATSSELNALDHSIYSAINSMRGQNKRAGRNSVYKEIIKTIDFERISKNF